MQKRRILNFGSLQKFIEAIVFSSEQVSRSLLTIFILDMQRVTMVMEKKSLTSAAFEFFGVTNEKSCTIGI